MEDEGLGGGGVGAGASSNSFTVGWHGDDGAGRGGKDALLEVWQADLTGLFNSPSEIRGTADRDFRGWGRQPTDGETGLFRFNTIKPGAVPWPDGRMQAPHISLCLVSRGINLGLHTRFCLFYPLDPADHTPCVDISCPGCADHSN